jgi:type II secretory pathway component PulK
MTLRAAEPRVFPVLRRGFALPLVLMLVLICSILLAVLLQGHSTMLLNTQRQIDTYAFGHATRGVGEALNLVVQGREAEIAQALDPDGKIVEFHVDGGQVLSVYLEDGQGKVLSNLSGLGTENYRLGREVLRRLGEVARERAPLMIRGEGPLAISVNSAPEEVIRAALSAITGGEGGDGLARDIVRRRSAEGVIAADDLRTMISGSELSDEQKGRANALLTASPTLWRVWAVLESGDPFVPAQEYTAWATFLRSRSASPGDRATSAQRSVAIFGWERVTDRTYSPSMRAGARR